MTGLPLAWMIGLVALTMVVIHVVPKFTRLVPAPLAGILVVAAIVIGFGIAVPRVGDMASIAGGLPEFHIPSVPLTFETLDVILPYARHFRRHRPDRKPADPQPGRRNDRHARRRVAGVPRPGRWRIS